MIKIGDFANLFNVSIKTVRYYESMGLLIPKYVDIYTGYRYYDEDNIYTMQDILSLKNMGFSLEEIRHFSKDKIKDKISNYEQEILNLKSRIKVLKQFSLSNERNDLKIMFINDEETQGKWTLLGIAETIEEAKKENFRDDDYKINELYLLPNGEPYWVISWTKDTIFIGGKPNHYEIIGDKLYLTVADFLDIKNSKVAVYYNVDHNDYTLEDIKQKDNIDVEFVTDERVIGSWKTIDFVNNPESFNPEKLQSSREMLSLEKLVFKDNGIVNVSYVGGKKFDTKYTKNYIVNLILPNTLCKYTYEEILSKEYIIVEWKSGDYVFGKFISGYYVLEKID